MTNNVINFLEKAGLNVIVLDGKNDEEILGLKKEVKKKPFGGYKDTIKKADQEFGDAMDNLIKEIQIDYKDWCKKAKITHTANKNYYYEEGKKYARVWMECNQKSCWGFVVMTKDDAKFKYGDILMASGWKAPARNKARGNIFGEYAIRWTGPNYLN